MQARNANLNLRRLGAVATEFLPDFYGITTSSLHHGLPTDRLLVRWDLSAQRVRERASRPEPPAGGRLPRPAPRQRREVAGGLAGVVGAAARPRGRGDPARDPSGLGRAVPGRAPRGRGLAHARCGSALRYYLSRGYAAADFAPTEEGGRRRPLYILRKA